MTRLGVARFDLASYDHSVIGLRFVSSAAFSDQGKFYLDYVQVEGTVAGKARPVMPYTVWLPTILQGTTQAAGGNMPIEPAKVKFDTSLKYVADWFGSAELQGRRRYGKMDDQAGSNLMSTEQAPAQAASRSQTANCG